MIKLGIKMVQGLDLVYTQKCLMKEKKEKCF